MTRQEKLIVGLVAVVLITRIGHIAVDTWFASQYGAMATPTQKAMWRASFTLVTALQNIAAAVWIYVEAKTAALRAWIWSLLGLCFGVLGIALFYAAQIYLQRQPNNSFKPKPLRGSA